MWKIKYSEYCFLKGVLNSLSGENIDECWVHFFSKTETPNLLLTVEHALSIPARQSYITNFLPNEKSGSDERNHLRPEIIKAELCVKVNYNFNCLEFFF
mgnify:CR=1 FL=1